MLIGVAHCATLRLGHQAETELAQVPTICRMIAWICPGIDDPAKPAMIRDAAGLLDDLMRNEDKALRDRWVAEIDRLRNEPRPAIVQRDNVVSLFREIAG